MYFIDEDREIESPPPPSVSSPAPNSLSPPNATQGFRTPLASRRKRRRVDTAENIFLRCERNEKKNERERDRIFVELERERIRQRDTELQLLAQWLEFIIKAMDALVRLLDGNK